MKYSILFVLISGQKYVILMKMDMDSEVTKKRVGYTGDTKESKKHGCVCTFCHANGLSQYKCVIFLKITITLTFLLLTIHYHKDIEKLDRRNSYASNVMNNEKMVNTETISKIV